MMLDAPEAARVSGKAAHSAIDIEFYRSVPTSIRPFYIPGATSFPLKTEGLCGDRLDKHIPSQVFDPNKVPKPTEESIEGGNIAKVKYGGGLPDLVSQDGGIVELAEVKPASWSCYTLGLDQLNKYVDEGNRTEYDDELRSREQQAWRDGRGIERFERMMEDRFALPITLDVEHQPVTYAWCPGGIIVYKVLKKEEKEDEEQQTNTLEIIFQLWMLAAALGAAAAREGGKKVAQKASGGAAAAAAIMATIALISTTEAEASVGLEGEDPIVALLKVLGPGTIVSSEVFDKLPPEVKTQVEAALRNGEISEAQQMLSDELAQIVSENITEFTPEELETLLLMSEYTKEAAPTTAGTLEELRTALEHQAAGTGTAGGAETSDQTVPTEK